MKNLKLFEDFSSNIAGMDIKDKVILKNALTTYIDKYEGRVDPETIKRANYLLETLSNK